MRPVTIRADAEHARLDDELPQLRSRQLDLSAEVADTRAQLTQSKSFGEHLAQLQGELRDDLDRMTAYGEAIDDVVGAVLLRELSPGVRRRTSSASECSRVICSLATGEYRSLLSRSALSFERYAERWGWDLVLSTEDLADGRPAPWGKVPLLRSLLDEYDWVLWLDADVVIVDLDADINDEVQEGKDLYLVEHPWLGQYTANSGVVLLRSCDWSRAFLDEVWALDQYAEHPRWENAAVLDLLGYGLEPARLVEPTPWLKRTKLIDRRWNSIELDRSVHPAFVHRGFCDVRTRVRQVTGDLACALGSADPLTAGWDRPARRISTVTEVGRPEEVGHEALRGALAARLGVSPSVHGDDMIWKFIMGHQNFENAEAAVRYYFDDGAASAAKLAEVIGRNLAFAGDASPSLLEFASGYGCVSRHLARALPGWNVTSCDIHPQAVDFLTTDLQIHAVMSTDVPEELAIGEYDTVFALSFFSHMPLNTWGRWLRALFQGVKSGGLLVFTTHGMTSWENFGRPELADGFWFEAISEQHDLEGEIYGSTVTAPSFVVREIYRQLGAPIAEFLSGYWWSHQDLWVVANTCVDNRPKTARIDRSQTERRCHL